jgi:hypothetical protein
MKDFFGRFKVQLALATGVLVGFGVALALTAPPARADIDLGDLVKQGVKVVGVNAIVTKYDHQIDDAINKLLDNNNCGTGAATRVVTVVSPLGRKYIGAAQVTGPKAQVEKVKAVVQLEQSFMGKMFRLKAMIPADSQDPTKFHRVDGVGVSAVVDIHL